MNSGELMKLLFKCKALIAQFRLVAWKDSYMALCIDRNTNEHYVVFTWESSSWLLFYLWGKKGGSNVWMVWYPKTVMRGKD